MLISRGANLLKIVASRVTPRKAVQPQFLVPRRNSGGTWSYRDIHAPHKHDVLVAEILGGFMWWWILWHCWHDWGHVVGEFPYPDPSKWTDEELGIPPDD